MEDMLSAVDRGSASVIMERLFGSAGLLRELGTTVVMATHSGKEFPDCYLFPRANLKNRRSSRQS